MKALKLLLAVLLTATMAAAQLGTSIEVVLVEAGSFSTTGGAVHNVTLTEDFWIGKYPVTQAQYQAIMGNNPSWFSGRPNNPVEMVTWANCTTFARRAGGFLPTEAQWEFAARGGNLSKGFIYSGSNNIDEVAWHWENGRVSTLPVGQKKPNELGIYDMSGNVWEWTADLWQSTYPSSSMNPTGATSGSLRVLRGGSWNTIQWDCRVAFRGNFSPGNTNNLVGFRVAFNPSIVKKIRYEKNNGSAAYVVGIVGDATIITRPIDPTKWGYVFAGWYKDAELTEKWDFATDLITHDTTLYAKWTTAEYTITYILNGGTNSAENPTTYNVETETITLREPYRTAYTFDGWFNNSVFTGTPITQIVRGRTGNVTLYAKWVDTTNIDTTNIDTISIGIEVVLVEAGSFSTTGGAVHNVTLTEDFWIGKYPVTQTQYQAVTGNNPWGFSMRPNNPVEQVNWNEAVAFATAVGGFLSTEAQWEFAARGGNLSKGFIYSGSNDVNEVAWHAANSNLRTQPVGQKKPNELGIYDMSGNVSEWTADWWQGTYPSSSMNPTGAISGSNRVVRGGSSDRIALNCLVAHRDYIWPGNRFHGLGFRVAFNSSIELKKINYEKNNGSAAYIVGVVGAPTTITPPPIPTKDVMFFAGWYKNAELTEVWDFETDKVSTDTTLYAKWSGGSASIFVISKSNNRYGIKLTQNPVSDKAEISVILPNNEKAIETKIAIYDMTGNVVFSTTARDNASWDLRNSAGRFVANGTYLVIAEVKDRNGRTHAYSARLGVKR